MSQEYRDIQEARKGREDGHVLDQKREYIGVFVVAINLFDAQVACEVISEDLAPSAEKPLVDLETCLILAGANIDGDDFPPLKLLERFLNVSRGLTRAILVVAGGGGPTQLHGKHCEFAPS